MWRRYWRSWKNWASNKMSGIPKSLSNAVERLGISTFLLLFVFYFGFTAIVEPIAESYRTMVASVAKTNSLIRDEIQRDDANDEKRLEIATMKLDRIIDLLEALRDERSRPVGERHRYGMAYEKERGVVPSDQRY